MSNILQNQSMTQTAGNNDITYAELPESLMYGNILPRGFASTYKIWRVNPATSYQTYNTTDIVRFQFQTNDYIDPYNSFLEVEIEFDPANYLNTYTTHVGGINVTSAGDCPIFMLDGPSTSLIDSLILYSNSREVERIQAYDHVGYLLQDLGIGLKNRLFKPHEGNQLVRPMTNDNSPNCPPQIFPTTSDDTAQLLIAIDGSIDNTNATLASLWCNDGPSDY